MKNINNEVYNALGDIMFRTGASKDDLECAIERFMSKFFEDMEDEEK